MSLNEEAIEKDQAFDGLHGLWTSLETLAPQEVYAQYGELWRIEEGFRVLKCAYGSASHLSLDGASGEGAHGHLFRRPLHCCASCATSITACSAARSR